MAGRKKANANHRGFKTRFGQQPTQSPLSLGEWWEPRVAKGSVFLSLTSSADRTQTYLISAFRFIQLHFFPTLLRSYTVECVTNSDSELHLWLQYILFRRDMTLHGWLGLKLLFLFFFLFLTTLLSHSWKFGLPLLEIRAVARAALPTLPGACSLFANSI